MRAKNGEMNYHMTRITEPCLVWARSELVRRRVEVARMGSARASDAIVLLVFPTKSGRSHRKMAPRRPPRPDGASAATPAWPWGRMQRPSSGSCFPLGRQRGHKVNALAAHRIRTLRHAALSPRQTAAPCPHHANNIHPVLEWCRPTQDIIEIHHRGPRAASSS